MKHKCKSCGGKGWLLDTTYDRSGEAVPCMKCYSTGMSQEAIHKVLGPQRMKARKAAIAARTTDR